jgi:acyl carrier protein
MSHDRTHPLWDRALDGEIPLASPRIRPVRGPARPMLINEQVAEAVSRLTGIPVVQLRTGASPDLALWNSIDSLDRVELLMDLEGEFDAATTHWAMRYIDLLAERDRAHRRRGPIEFWSSVFRRTAGTQRVRKPPISSST